MKDELYELSIDMLNTSVDTMRMFLNGEVSRDEGLLFLNRFESNTHRLERLMEA